VKKLIEYKLWAGQIPYFVDDPLGGVFNGGKCYGVSKDTHCCYVPDTLVVLTVEQLSEVVLESDLVKPSGTNPMVCVPMTPDDKAEFLNAWLVKNGIVE